MQSSHLFNVAGVFLIPLLVYRFHRIAVHGLAPLAR